MSLKTKIAALAVAATVMVGGAAVAEGAVAKPKHQSVCVVAAKKQEKVPSRALALCDQLAVQAAYESRDGSSYTPKGKALVKECRLDGWSEHREYGAKVGAAYVVSCLRGQIESWLEQQPKK